MVQMFNLIITIRQLLKNLVNFVKSLEVTWFRNRAKCNLNVVVSWL